MILEIRLANFFSIGEEVTLNLQAANLQTKKAKELSGNTFTAHGERLLKTVAIYGANASGKSSIVKAIRACVQMILESHNYNENTTFGFTPFKFGEADRPSSFFIRFMIGEVEYEYAFSMTRKEIITEELYYYPNGRRSIVFTRDERKGPDKRDVYNGRGCIRRPMDVASNTSKKTLFVSRASQMDREVAKEVFNFFSEQFAPNYIDFDTTLIESSLNEHKELLLKALKIADSDIVDIRVQQYSPLKITTYHRNNPEVPFDFFTEESDGTQRLFRMMLTLLHIIRENKVLLIDEIETSLHPKLVEYILRLFHHSSSAQLIFTTHNTRLLSLDLLRRDQIYFVNKRQDGSTDLYSLYDYKDFQESMDVEQAYMMGRFEAIPYIDNSSYDLISE
jgi:AAA15 family ATPase/GTPase